jgi:hypothetical protein
MKRASASSAVAEADIEQATDGAAGALSELLSVTPDPISEYCDGGRAGRRVPGCHQSYRGKFDDVRVFDQVRLFRGGQMVAELSRRVDYSVLRYTQPSVPQQPSNFQGVSFNGVQKIDSQWGLFLRANYASGTAIPIETSIAWGGINDNPFHRNKLDQVELGLFWDKTNRPAVGQPMRNAEWGAELYYNYTLFKALRLTPDIQLYFDPALHPDAGPASAVFTIRTTAFF